MKKLFPLVIIVPFIVLSVLFNDPFYSILGIASLILAFLMSSKIKFPKIKIPKFKFKIKNQRNDEILPTLENSVSEEVNKKKFRFTNKITFDQLIVLFLFLALFTVIGILKLPSVGESNIFFEYYSSSYLYIKDNPYILTTLLLPLLLIVFYKFKFHASIKNTFKKTISYLLAIFLSFNLSLAALFLIAAVFIQSYSGLQYFGVTKNMITSGRQEIVEKIKKDNKPPQIVLANDSVKKTVISKLIPNKTSKFLTDNLYSDIPKFVFSTFPVKEDDMVLVRNFLVVNRINKNDIEIVSPIIGRLILESSFKGKLIKSEPSFSVMSRQEYLKFREDQINEQVAEYEVYIAEAQDYVDYYAGQVAYARNQIQQSQDALPLAIARRDSDYQDCLSAGYTSYYFGDFYRYYTDAECENERNQWSNFIAEIEQSLVNWQQALRNNQYQLSLAQEVLEYMIDQKELVASQKESTPNELGVFLPDATIKVALDSSDPRTLADFYSTVVHEYLHYTSYVSEERVLPSFFEEGLTEYFSRKAIKNSLNVDTNSGYPVMVKVIEQMMEKIPEDEFLDIYFTKDEDDLIALLDSTYGKGFYEQSELYLNLMFYVPPRDSLNFANNVMFRIGGKELKEEDLYSEVSLISEN